MGLPLLNLLAAQILSQVHLAFTKAGPGYRTVYVPSDNVGRALCLPSPKGEVFCRTSAHRLQPLKVPHSTAVFRDSNPSAFLLLENRPLENPLLLCKITTFFTVYNLPAPILKFKSDWLPPLLSPPAKVPICLTFTGYPTTAFRQPPSAARTRRRACCGSFPKPAPFPARWFCGRPPRPAAG